MNRPFAIIGDIHGDARRLVALNQELEGRQLIFVGDYVNRGHETRETLDCLLVIQEHDPETIFLLGNHQAALLAFLDGSMPFYEFAGLGGIATIRAYLSYASEDVRNEFQKAFPDSHRRLIESCRNYFETSDVIVFHCGVNPSKPASRETIDMVMSRHEGLFSADFSPSKLVVCGHYVQRGGVAYVRDRFICLDTGCGTVAGPLTALLMPERTIVQR
jgi:serine/threonine protein phosphatase 1